MAYRYEKQQNGQQDLVIDGFEKGIASSPFKGIGNIRNLNIKYYEGVAYVNYKRQPCTMNGGTLANPLWATQSPAGIIYISDDNRQIWKQDAVNGSSFTRLTGNSGSFNITGLSFWNNYLFSLCDGLIEICGDGTGDGGVTSGNWNSPALPTTTFTVTIASPAVFTTSSAHGLSVGDNVRFTTTGALPTGLNVGTSYFVIAAGLTSTQFEVSSSAPPNSTPVNTSGSQSGVHSFTVARGVWPIQNTVTLTLVNSGSPLFPAKGVLTATLDSYTDAKGVTRNIWNGPTGNYFLSISLTDGTTQIVSAFLTQGSNTITWTPTTTLAASAVTATLFFNGATAIGDTGIQHQPIIPTFDGNLYFTNKSAIGGFTRNAGCIFNKNDMTSFTFYAGALELPPTETTAWITQLLNKMVVLGQYTLYLWDFVNPVWTNGIPINENLTRGINILNNLYIFAGNKGNIYVSNGYSISRYNKLPDYIAGVVDPAWTIGGTMTHRQKLYFQALAKNGQTGSVVYSGIFSLDLDTGALNMENENSGGITPAGMLTTGLLIDVNSTAVNYDKYYSAYGATTPRIDFNDTTLYSNNEPLIETDIIPVGTFLQNKNFASAEFKLDQPLRSGDSISLYARQSLSDSYTLLGTTSTTLLADCFQSIPIQNWQWAQFKITMSCNPTATSSSFNRLREIRIR